MATSPISRVFINCPFDDAYSKLFLYQIAALVCLSRTPRCALELPDDGRGRLQKLFALIKSCDISVHDLSRVGTPVRFNMPFELGIACTIMHELKEHHEIRILERMPNRLGRTLSDLRFIDPIIHGGSHIQLVNGFVEAFPVRRKTVQPSEIHAVTRTLFDEVDRYRRSQRIRSVFNGSIFQYAVAVGARLAAAKGMIAD